MITFSKKQKCCIINGPKCVSDKKQAIVETITEYITIGQDSINIGLSHLPLSSKQTSPHNFKDVGILIIRVAIGAIMLAFHGIPKLMMGPSNWEKVSAAIYKIGITFAPSFWGFAAVAAECVGALLIMIGLFMRPSALVLAFTMLIAFISHLAKGDTLAAASHPLELLFIFLALAVTGAGKYSLDRK